MSERVNDRDLSPETQDRRAGARERAATLGDVTTRFVGGGQLTLLNYGPRSLYGQSPARLLVGSRISVRLATATLNAVVSGRVVRSSLTQIVNGAPHYEVALSLEQEVDWEAVKARPAEPPADDDSASPELAQPSA
jgi:hypothetical protein